MNFVGDPFADLEAVFQSFCASSVSRKQAGAGAVLQMVSCVASPRATLPPDLAVLYNSGAPASCAVPPPPSLFPTSL